MADIERAFDNLLVWQIDWTRGYDSAWTTLKDGSMHARGLIAAQHQDWYTVTYSLETDDELITRTLSVESNSAIGGRSLHLANTREGWFADGEFRADLAGALDCDLEGCPLTNTMPILRHGLQRTPVEVTLKMAFVRFPSLEVVPSEQTYTHIRLLGDGRSLVRYSSGDFESDLLIDVHGFVEEYPKLGAHRVAAL